MISGSDVSGGRTRYRGQPDRFAILGAQDFTARDDKDLSAFRKRGNLLLDLAALGAQTCQVGLQIRETTIVGEAEVHDGQIVAEGVAVGPDLERPRLLGADPSIDVGRATYFLRRGFHDLQELCLAARAFERGGEKAPEMPIERVEGDGPVDLLDREFDLFRRRIAVVEAQDRGPDAALAKDCGAGSAQDGEW
jgi:hypothetical protein